MSNDSVTNFVQATGLKYAAYLLFAFSAGDIFGFGNKIKEATYRQIGIDRHSLREIANHLFHKMCLCDDIFTADTGMPRRWRKESSQDTHGGALPSSVGAEKTDYLTARNVKGN